VLRVDYSIVLVPHTEKLLSPRRVLVRGTVRALASAERRRRRSESAMSWQSSARYDGSFAVQRLEDQKGQLEIDPFLYSRLGVKTDNPDCKRVKERPNNSS